MSGRLLSLLAVTTLVAGLSTLTGAPAPKAGETTADWPQFRGPKRDNVSPDKGLVKRWPKDGPKLAWKGEGVGQGFSSVAVVGHKVFTMGDKDGSSHVFALARATGKPLWATKVGEAGGNYAGTRCTPTVNGKLVYALGQFGDLVCLDIEKGEEKWRKNFPKDFGGRVSTSWNYCESPLVDGDWLVCTPGGAKACMVALDKMTGKEIWRCPEDIKAGYSSIVISHAGGVKQYVQLTGEGTIGVDAKDGKLLWKYKKLAHNTANIPTPIVVGDQVFTTAGYGRGGALLAITKINPKSEEPKEVYYNSELQNKHGGVTIVGNYVYGDTDDSGHPYCANWKTGKVVWKRSGRSIGTGSASITYADGNLYVRYQNGWVALVPASLKGYNETSTFKIPNTGGPSWSHPVVIGGKLYLREKDIVWCYDVKAK